MTLERDIYLTFTKDIDVKRLSYGEMLHWDKHNVFNHLNFMFAIKTRR